MKYEFENATAPMCPGNWWAQPEGRRDWVIVGVFQGLAVPVFIIEHPGGEMTRVDSPRYRELYASGRWTGPIPVPEDKPTPSEDEKREMGKWRRSSMAKVELGSGCAISVELGSYPNAKIILSVPWHHVSLTTDQAYALICALLEVLEAQQKRGD